MIYKRIKNCQINSIVLFTQRNSLHLSILDCFNTENASFVNLLIWTLKTIFIPVKVLKHMLHLKWFYFLATGGPYHGWALGECKTLLPLKASALSCIWRWQFQSVGIKEKAHPAMALDSLLPLIHSNSNTDRDWGQSTEHLKSSPFPLPWTMLSMSVRKKISPAAIEILWITNWLLDISVNSCPALPFLP